MRNNKVHTGPHVTTTPGQDIQVSEGTIKAGPDTLKLQNLVQMLPQSVNKTKANREDELSMRNLQKVNSLDTHEKDNMPNKTRESNGEISSNQQVTPQNLHIIDPVSAQIEVVKDTSSVQLRYSHKTFKDNKTSAAEYEEFRQAGIISKKFSSNLHVTEGKCSVGSIGFINRDSNLNQPKFFNNGLSVFGQLDRDKRISLRT